MKSVIVLSETDTWNRNPVFIGVFTDKKKAIKIVKELTKKCREGVIDKEDLDCIERYNQTQGRETNYLFEEVMLNKNYL